MSCKPSDILELAQSIGNTNGCCEAELRCATSRGYYAALHTVDAVVPSIPQAVRQKNEGSHAFIIRRVQKYGDGANPGRLEAKKIAFAMKRLKDQRNDADYRLNIDYSVREKEDALERVIRILAHCDALRVEIMQKTEQAEMA